MASAMELCNVVLGSLEKQKDGQAPPAQLMIAYGGFISLAVAVYHFVADREFSAVMTMSVMFQCLSMLLLLLQTCANDSAAGISARSLGLEATAIFFRLSSTLWLNGYLPTDASGDFVFQVFDVGSLVLAVILTYRVAVVQQRTYDSEHDSLDCRPILFGSFVLATLFHGDMNLRPLFDTLWMTGHMIGAVAVLPQLWLILHTGGRIEALTSHYIATMAFSRVLCGIFMWHARFDITCEEWVEEWNHAVVFILGAHIVQLFLLADFGYYYAKAVWRSGFTACVEVPTMSDIV